MQFVEDLLSRLSATDLCAYVPGGSAATEPTALAAIALFAFGRDEAATPLTARLMEMQNEDGSLGITRLEKTPCWPTAWAALAWRAAQSSSVFDVRNVVALDAAIRWLSNTRGEIAQSIPGLAHDTKLQGWPWVQGTHSWVEPTAISLLALRAVRREREARAVEARRLLVDRLITSGGCNYGNTVVLGQTLRPHVQPTGLCLLALAGEEDPDGRIARSVEYLERELSARTPTLSLCYGLLGLAARDAYPAQADAWLAAAAERTLANDPAAHKLALLALASQGTSSPLITRAWGYRKAREEANS